MVSLALQCHILGPRTNFTVSSPRPSVDISPINVISPICFHQTSVENGNDDNSSEEHLKIRKPWEILIYCSFKTVNFCPNIQRDPVSLNPPQIPPCIIKVISVDIRHSAWYKKITTGHFYRRSSLCLALYTSHILFVASLVCVVKQMNAARKQTTRTHGLEIIFQN